MENIISITHATDIDGVGSAALIKRKYDLPASHLFFGDYNGEHAKMLEREIAPYIKQNTTLYVADLSFSNKTSGSMLRIINKIKRKNGKIYWYDHHPWPESEAKMVRKLCQKLVYGENKSCGTELTRKELGMGEKFADYFCKIVHFSDFNIKPKVKKEYNLVGFYALSIAYYHTLPRRRTMAGLRHIADVISSGRLSDGRIRNDARKYKRINDLNTKRMINEIYLGDDIALGFSGDIQKTYACMKLIEETGKDIGVYVNLRDHRGHMRSIKSDCSRLANRFHGGGHPHASGFSPDFIKYHGFKARRDRERFLIDLNRMANRIGVSTKKNQKENRSSREPLFN